MRTHTVMTWGLVAAMAMGLTLPGMADKPTRRDDDKLKVCVTVVDTDSNDDVKAFQAWYGREMRDYDRVDRETGERLNDLLQVVVDIRGNQLLVTDQSGLRRGVLVNGRTRLTIDEDFDRRDRRTLGVGAAINSRLAEIFREGDLIIAEGYLRVNGGISATNIRLMGHVRGYGRDDDEYDRGYRFRAWGEVRSVDVRDGEFEIDTSLGRRIVQIERNATILENGREVRASNIRRGDRVIVYSRDINRGGKISAFRVVLLNDREAFPRTDRPHPSDPDYRNDRDNRYDGPVLEGRLLSISTGLLFNKMVVRANNGRDVTVRFSKTLQAIDRDGDRISPLNLYTNERLRIYYNDLGGNYFAERIEVD